MSTEYWICNGIGINVEYILPRLDKKKCMKFIESQIDGVEIEEKEFDINKFIEYPFFDNIADMLTYCDDTDTLTYTDNGEGTYYFLYEPSYPWLRLPKEPETREEVYENIIKAVRKITNMQSYEIRELIEDIYDWGCGWWI